MWLEYQNRRHDLRLRKAQQAVADARESGHQTRGFDAGRRTARVPACLDVVERGRRGFVDDPCPAVIATGTNGVQQQFEIAKSAMTQAVAAAESMRDRRLQRDLDLIPHVPIVEMAERVQARQPDAGGAVTPCGHG